MLRHFILLFFLFFTSVAISSEKVLNIYVWFGEIPDTVIQKFEKETGIKVNYATYDSNETLYAKLKASRNSGYDLIQPSGYYVDRMWHENMLEPLNTAALSNYHNINPRFLKPAYDPQGKYAIPYVWGITGIFVNEKYYSSHQIKRWGNFWEPRFHNQILLLDDAREVFAVALLSMGYSATDVNPEHIKQAYLKLRALWPNIKLFNSNALPSIPIDEDAVIGMAWNGDIYKAQQENSNIKFIFPEDGFVIWVDNLAIPKNAPHPKAAYQFLNYLLRGDIAAQTTLIYGFPTTNQASLNFLPKKIVADSVIFPSNEVLARGQFQKDVGDVALNLYNHYWELLKLGG